MGRERETVDDAELLRTYDAEPGIIVISSEEAAARGGRAPQRIDKAQDRYDDRPGR